MRTPLDMQENCIHQTKNSGKLKVLMYRSSMQVDVIFISTGYKTTSTSNLIRSGQIKDKLYPSVYGFGFIGCGIHKSSFNGKLTKQYKCWLHMLERCYSEKYHKMKPTYKECSVCDEWLNFQNFADWHIKNHPKESGVYHLDKDLTVSGNKVYSPQACSFISANENITGSLSGSFSFINPDGEVVNFKNLRRFCRENGLSPSAMSHVHSGKGKSHKGWKAANKK